MEDHWVSPPPPPHTPSQMVQGVGCKITPPWVLGGLGLGLVPPPPSCRGVGANRTRAKIVGHTPPPPRG